MEMLEKEGRVKNKVGKQALSKHHVRIAVVEDDLMYRQAIEVYLRKVPESDVKSFESGEHYFRYAGQTNPDILILDYRLNESTAGGMDGLEVLRKAKTQSPGTKVIFLAGQGNMDVAIAAIKGGADDFITKDKNGLSRLVNHVQRIALAIQMKRQESKTTRMIFAGLAAIALILLGTIAADSEGMHDVWNWLWFILCIGLVVVLMRSWVKRSRSEMKKIQSLERRGARWLD